MRSLIKVWIFFVLFLSLVRQTSASSERETYHVKSAIQLYRASIRCMRFGMHISINKWLSFFFNLWKRYSSPVSCLTKLLQVTYPNIFHIYALPIFFILLISSLYSWCIACKFWYRILKFKLKTERRETRKQCERFPPHAKDSYLCSRCTGQALQEQLDCWLVPYMRMHPRKMKTLTFWFMSICKGKVAIGVVFPL
jgi:hypothetical protein